MSISERPLRSASLPGVGARTLCEAFQRCVATGGDEVALRTPDDAVRTSWTAYGEHVDRIAGGLAALGVSPGDTVGMMLVNRPECCWVDMAALHLGATPFSIYTTSAPEQIAYLFSNADNRVVITERCFAEVILAVGAPLVEHVVVVDGEVPGTMTLAELEASGDGFDAASAARAVTPEAIATLIYTSGTTGPPKGVQLTHANLLAVARAMPDVVPLPAGGRMVSYLPFAHIADRFFGYYLALATRSAVTVVPDPTQALAAWVAARPTSLLAVPRTWEKVMAALQAQGITDPAVLSDDARAGVRAKLGLDAAEVLACGAAPVAVEVLEFFRALGLPILEGWGMSEISAVGCLNRLEANRPGTVGLPLPGVELRVLGDGELLVRGPGVMTGYRKDPEKTAEALDADGWMHTGDVVELDANGFVTIVDRKKELIISAGGKNMSPANIEQRLKASSPLIGQACAIGDRRPYNTALLVLDPEAAASWAAAHGRADASPAALVADPELQVEIAAAVAEANTHLSRVEQIKRFTVLPVDWLPGGEELTPTMKLRRKPIAERYAREIEALYQQGGNRMSEDNKVLARRYIEAFSTGAVDALDAIIAPDWVDHDTQAPPTEARGAEVAKEQMRGYRASFPDLTFTIEDQIAEGDRVVTRWTAVGTHDGDFGELAATGRQATVTGIAVDRIDADRIAESWTNWDTLGLLQQIGAIPAPAEA